MNKTLVAYFSATGTTRRLAEKISKALDADIFEIKPAMEYTFEDLKWPSRSNRSCLEMKNKKSRPGILNRLENTENYHTIFLGFPVWYYTAPTIINHFIEENDLNGKDVYIFVTSGVNTADKSLKDLRKAYPHIHFVSGKRFNGVFYDKEVYSWISKTAI